ncbi:AAR_G0021950.mRNA.1.CDS.1 [Saccharomyces cerevisiae]|nr:Crh1p [Saccharomyces cerevisiae YJM193]AJR79262.1 Crh1p [Saccharomyces cerevisiae YJM271]CAI4496701.1 AIG_G0021870.mRNA.1.CDS.1 [Saccharomyces cerevisiae]CAI4497670.1 AAR_G0021950.mRNA.1.CDS.1 [Saccharomyces cerevisiae]CAI5265273.1 CFF_HP2_G0019350.mRNA.1.CDS.1 [Saccharomyces cerevisiae]
MKVLDLLTVLSASSLLSTFAAAESTATADSTTAASSTASCNPLKTTGCTPDTALATSFSEDFSSSSKWFTDLKHAGEIKYGSDGLSMTLAKRYDNPSLKSNFYIMYGKLEVILKAANGTGIVSSFYLQSDDLDEIDIEWVGGDNTQFQSNFFSKGDTTTYDRGEFHGVDTPTDKFHNYTLDWAMDKTTWYLDGESVRVLSNTSSEGYPQSPMYLMMGIWAGGDPDNAAGTIEWAGGETNYNDAPFTMYIEKVIVTDYSTGKKYTYGDQSGSWESIEADGGSIYGRYDQAQEDFAVLANGGSISSSSTSSSTVSSSASSTVSSSVSSTVSSSASSTVSSSVSSTVSSSSPVSSSSSTSPSSSTATSSKTLASSSVTTSSSISSFEKQSSSSSKKTVASSSTSESIISSTKTPATVSSTPATVSSTPATVSSTPATVSSTTRSTVAPTTQQSSVSSDSPVQDKGGVATSSNDVTSSTTQISSKYTSTIQSSSSEASSTNSVQISNGADLAQSLPREGKLFSVLVALLALL